MKISKWTSLVLALTIGALGLVSADTARAASPQPPTDYRLVWSDEFDTLDLGDRAGAWLPYWRSWGVRHLAGNNDQAGKFADHEMLEGGITAGAMLQLEGRWGDGPYLHEASGGTLKLRAYPLSSAGRAKAFGFPFIAAMISGERQPALNHGYWETRLRINRLGDGMHLGVWLLSDTHEWPPEIDILEVVGLDPAKFHATTHVRQGEAPPITGYRAPNGAHGWHVFGFEWTDDQMRWTVDGRTVREHENVFGDERLYFLVSWEIGGKWPGMPTGNTPWPGEVEIDYVRLYEKAPAAARTPATARPPAGTGAKESPEAALPPAPEPAPEPAPVITKDTPQPPETEETTQKQPVIETASTPPGSTAGPEQPALPEAVIEPTPTTLPQPSLSWRFEQLRRLSAARGRTLEPSPQTVRLTPPERGPEQRPPIASFADWQAMRDRARLFDVTR